VDFIGAKGDGGGGKKCKAPVKMSPPTNQHPVFYHRGCPSCRPTNSVKALNERVSVYGCLYVYVCVCVRVCVCVCVCIVLSIRTESCTFDGCRQRLCCPSCSFPSFRGITTTKLVPYRCTFRTRANCLASEIAAATPSPCFMRRCRR